MAVVVFFAGSAVAQAPKNDMADKVFERVEAAGEEALPRRLKAETVLKAEAIEVDFNHEIWGMTDIGEGYVYGPTNRRSGMTVVDIDLDGDNDFVFPSTISSPLLMTNLGSSSAFYPGGSKVLDADDLPEGYQYSISLAFADLTGDALPDMVAVVQRYDPDQKAVAYFRNDGSTTAPYFSYQGLVYTDSQAGYMPAMWVALADINGDGLTDLFVVESFVTESAPYHRVFELENEGSSTQPDFKAAVEIRTLSNLLPDRLSVSEKGNARASKRAFPPPDQEDPRKAAKASYSYNIGDFDFADWNSDGVLDFMFYDRSRGLFWAPNLGSVTDPVWADYLGSNGSPRYDHQAVDDLDTFEGTFAVRENPEAAKPGVEWLRDVFLSVGSRVKTYRFFTAEDTYRIVQQAPVAYPAGMGAAAFWDYDYDGDLDLFRMAVSSASSTEMLLFPNKGTPYAPAWAWEYLNLDTVVLDYGNADNDYRHDLFVIADHDGVDGADLFVQGQDGNVRSYWAYSSPGQETAPTFQLANANYGNLVASWHSNAWPHGLAMADFNQFDDGWMEIFIAYTHDDGANLVLGDTYTGQVYDLPDFLPAPDENWAKADGEPQAGPDA